MMRRSCLWRWAAALCLVTLGQVHAAEPIVIGQSLGLLPPDRQTQEVLAGTAAYVEAVNARGGIGGRRLRLITLDDGNVPARHAQNLRKLVNEERAVAIVNCVGEAICRVAASVANELRVPLVGVQTGSAGVSHRTNAYVFRIRPTWEKEADTVVLQLKAQGLARAALVTDQLIETEPLKWLRAAATRHALALETVPLSATTPEAFKQLMATFSQKGFQAAVLELQPTTIEAIRAAGVDALPEWPLTLMAMSSVSLDYLRTGFPKRVIGYTTVVPNPESTAVSLSTELRRYAETNAVSGGYVAVTTTGLESYISLKVLADALRRSSPGKPGEAERLLSALEGMNGVDLGGYNISFASGKASGSDFVEMAFRPRQGAAR